MALGFLLLISVALLSISFITILNVLTMKRLTTAPTTSSDPFLSFLIPARNEGAIITNTVTNILNQEYQNLEVIILDDHSTDNTAALVKQAAQNDPRIQVLTGKSLPDGWTGKNWACYQLAEVAQGDYLVFTDADVQWRIGAALALAEQISQTDADLITIWSTQETVTIGERLVVPLMAFVIMGYLPHLAVNHVPLAAFAAANGQCMAFRRAAYRAIDGHSRVRNEIVEDIRLAQHIKRAGLRLRMIDGNKLVQCRMYQSWSDVRNGYAKNITSGYGDSLIGLLLGTLFHWSILLFPWLWLVISLQNGNTFHTSWSLILIIIGILIRALTAAATQQRIQDAIFLPVSAILMTIIAGQSAYWYIRFGGPRWKNRTIIRHKRRWNNG